MRDSIRLAASNDWVLPAFSVNIATPADQYQLTDRAVKYAVLLIVLTFLAFFVFESLTARQMHPMQYMLVGLSLVMFYLVLLALSEHTGFTLAPDHCQPARRIAEWDLPAGCDEKLARQFTVYRCITLAGWCDVGAAEFRR